MVGVRPAPAKTARDAGTPPPLLRAGTVGLLHPSRQRCRWAGSTPAPVARRRNRQRADGRHESTMVRCERPWPSSAARAHAARRDRHHPPCPRVRAPAAPARRARPPPPCRRTGAPPAATLRRPQVTARRRNAEFGPTLFLAGTLGICELGVKRSSCGGRLCAA